MALLIEDDEAERLVRQFAEIKQVGLEEAVKLAVNGELKRAPLAERIRPIQERVLSRGCTGLVADKAFFDELSSD